MTTIVAALAVQGAFIEHERKLERLGAHCIELRQASDLRKPFDALVLPGGESTVQGKLLTELGMMEPLRQRIEDGTPVLATCAGLILLAQHVTQGDEAPSRQAASDSKTAPDLAAPDNTLPSEQAASGSATPAKQAASGGATSTEQAAPNDTPSADRPEPRSAQQASANPGGPYLATLPITVRRNAYGRQLASFRTEGELAGIGRAPLTFIRAPFVEHAAPDVEVLARVDGNIVAVRYKNQLALAFHPELDEPNTVHQAFLDMAN